MEEGGLTLFHIGGSCKQCVIDIACSSMSAPTLHALDPVMRKPAHT